MAIPAYMSRAQEILRTRTADRLGYLVAQLDTAWEILRIRLRGLTDAEYLWEPVPGCWSLRPRAEATTPLAFGCGEFVSDFDADPPDPPPFTTIAWRLCHIVVMEVLRHDHTFGSRELGVNDLELPSTADAAVVCITDSTRRWRDAVAALDDAQLDVVGLSQFPYGLDPHVPFGDLIWWMNLEFIHHSAEIACLRDLYRATGGAPLSRA